MADNEQLKVSWGSVAVFIVLLPFAAAAVAYRIVPNPSGVSIPYASVPSEVVQPSQRNEPSAVPGEKSPEAPASDSPSQEFRDSPDQDSPQQDTTFDLVNCRRLIDLYKSRYGRNWWRQIDRSRVLPCQPLIAEEASRDGAVAAPRLFGNPYCGNMILSAKARLGERWLEGVSERDAVGCAPQIERQIRFDEGSAVSTGGSDAFNQQGARPTPDTPDATYCLNLVARAKARLGPAWLQDVSGDDAKRCEEVIREQRRRDGR